MCVRYVDHGSSMRRSDRSKYQTYPQSLCPEWGSGNQPGASSSSSAAPGCGSIKNELPCKGLGRSETISPKMIQRVSPQTKLAFLLRREESRIAICRVLHRHFQVPAKVCCNSAFVSTERDGDFRLAEEQPCAVQVDVGHVEAA